MGAIGTIFFAVLFLAVCAHGWIVVSPSNASAVLPTGGGDVRFLAGTYTPDACSWSPEQFFASLDIQGAGSSLTIIDCGWQPWLTASLFVRLRIRGLTIVNAVHALQGDVRDVAVEDMVCKRSGSCLNIEAQSVTLTAISVSQARNSSVITSTGELTISEAHFQDVQSSGGGGALQLQAKTLSMTNVTISRAHARDGNGGAILITDPTMEAVVHMSNIRVDTASASGTGGAVDIQGTSIHLVTIQDLWTFNTSAPRGGGALHLSTEKEMRLSNISLEKCRAPGGECRSCRLVVPCPVAHVS